MNKVVIPQPDYYVNFKAAIERGDVSPDTEVPTVVYYTDILLRCPGRRCPDPSFTASFPEVQRIVLCPACGSEVQIPEGYRGMP